MIDLIIDKSLLHCILVFIITTTNKYCYLYVVIVSKSHTGRYSCPHPQNEMTPVSGFNTNGGVVAWTPNDDDEKNTKKIRSTRVLRKKRECC